MILKFFSFIALILSFSAFSQSEKTTHYLTQEENQIWLTSLKSLENKTLKLDAIKEKIISDSKYIGPRPGVSFTYLNSKQRAALRKDQDKKPKVTAACKILFVLQAKITYTLDLEKNPEYLSIVKMLNTENIAQVNSLKGSKATALFGYRASCGVVIMTSEDDRVAEALKQLNQKTTKS